MRISLQNEDGKEIANCINVTEGEGHWNLHHRFTDEAYRNKGIATQMIEATENCVQAYANQTIQDQIIEMEASQLPVLSIFLRKGYEIIEEDKKRFDEVMDKLDAGDSKYMLASCESDFQKKVDQRKTWYVFERETYERLGKKIWDYDPVSQTHNYIQHSVRFKLRKKIEPKSDDLVAETVVTRNQINSL